MLTRHSAKRYVAAPGRIALLIVLSMACGDLRQPVELSTPPPNAPPPNAPPAGPPAFPPLSRPGVIYVGDASIYDRFIAMHGSRIASRYVLYDDSTFSLQFASQRNPFFEYPGRFKRTDSLIAFYWDGSSTAGPWGATGTLRGDAMSVAYTIDMQMSDFIDGVYVRAPGH